jgi:cytidylate kinase
MAVVTISRQVGCGREEITQQLCDILGYSYFDKDLLVSEAIKLGLTEDEIIDFSEENYKAQTLMERLFSHSTRVVKSTKVRRRDETGIEKSFIRHLNEGDYIDLIHRVINAAYERGDIVIVGRGGQVILQKKPDVVHVRLTAPLSMRVQNIQEREGWIEAQALQYVLERDRAITEYLYRFFKVQWDDPTLYDLTIDTGEHGQEGTVKLIVDAVKALSVAA